VFGSRPIGCGPHAAFFSRAVVGSAVLGGFACVPVLRRWENQRMLSSLGSIVVYWDVFYFLCSVVAQD